MDPVEAILRSWPVDGWVVVPIVMTAALYVRGWLHLRQRGARRFGLLQVCCFLGGLLAVFLALASPIETFAPLLLQVHMVQHLLLMVAAPPLLWLGAPFVPFLRGLPVAVRLHWVAPFLRLPAVRLLLTRLTHPVAAWSLFLAATWLWHAPPLYERALRSESWHYVEHACFLGNGLLFWFVIVQPFPSRPRYSRWIVLPYLLLADLQNTALSALLAFSGRVLYPHYQAAPRLWGISALDDQAAAGAIMWVPGSIAYLVPLIVIAHRLLHGSDPGRTRRHDDTAIYQRIPLPCHLVTLSPCHPVPATSTRRGAASPLRRLDLLRLPLLGRFFRWRYARTTLQVPMFLLALAIVVDGLLGPQAAAMNLAGVLPWIHWRGLVVFALLVAGNIFCMACPFMLPRGLAKRWLPARWPWPRRLRGKWLALALLVGFFWAYEVFALWDSPWWTAWITLAYFLAAFVIDGFFRGAVFCKYVCPIGQFHFVQSLVSPLEVRVRDADVCLHCSTKDCIRGGSHSVTPSPRHSLTLTGCELHLFQPRKSGNMDCTFCLACIHACPHDNVGILATMPGADLLNDGHRSGVGRLSRRFDIAALVLVLVFGAFVNAGLMVAPVAAWQDRVAEMLGLEDRRLAVTVSLLAGMLIAPMLLVAAATSLGRWWSGETTPWLRMATGFTYALVPLGFGMWLAHYGFHFFTGVDGAIPVVQRGLGDLGLSFVGTPRWSCACCGAVADWVLRLEIIFLDMGLLGSLYLGYRVASQRPAPAAPALKAFAPWAALMLLLFAAGVWIVFQPMEMRGMLQG